MNNLDDILKQQMENFAPDAPNIWAGIEQGVQANAAAQTATVAKTVGSKLIITIAKIAAIIVVPVSALVYLASNEKSSSTEPTKIENKITSPSKDNASESIISLPQITENKKTTTVASIKEQKTKKQNSINLSDYSKTDLLNTSITKAESTDKLVVTNNTVNTIPQKETPINIYEEENSNEINSIEKSEQETEGNLQENSVGIKILPNVFTPNNDGIDDKYVIDLEGEKFYNFKIYNFNNELVFESNDKNTNWDGINFRTGQACNSGTYYGILLYKLANDEKNLTRMTKIKLIR